MFDQENFTFGQKKSTVKMNLLHFLKMILAIFDLKVT